MVLVKILGMIDLAAAILFLMLTFNMQPYFQFVLFCSGLLLLKGLFVLTGDVLSVVDIFSSAILLLSLVFTMPIVLLWIPAFLLLAKGIVSLL
ncbi:MAG: hypothetical protein AABX85_00135 [Nanoarchaeota archaeon]